ncbi:MAG: preprotein translocase subunit SecG [Clostridia bacterium]|nr:preprotein translocase subunit SecG [Clostridia bacterium]
MNIVKIILSVVYFIICFILVILTLKQDKGDEGLSSTITGAGSDNFYEQNKGKTREGRMQKWTIILGIVFVILTIALGTIYVM